MAGTLFGVSVGSGDPELMTVAAVKAIEKCKVIAVPRTKGEKTLALFIAQQAADLSEKEILFVDFPMSCDSTVLENNYIKISDMLCSLLENEDVAMLCLGDISVYSTFSYIAEKVENRGFSTVRIPGVTSFCAASAATGIALASRKETLHIIPYGCENFRKMLDLPGTKVVMKCGSHAPELLKILEESGLISQTYAVENCGLPNETIRHGSEISGECKYFTVFIIKTV